MFCPAKAKMIVDGVEKRLYGLCGEEFEDLYVKLEKEAFIRKAHLLRINREIEAIEEKINCNKATEEETLRISQENYGKTWCSKETDRT